MSLAKDYRGLHDSRYDRWNWEWFVPTRHRTRTKRALRRTLRQKGWNQ